MSDSIDYPAAAGYRQHAGDVMRVAVERVALYVATRDKVLAARATRPGAVPGPIWADTSAEAVAAKVLAQLLDAGWQPPSESDISTAVRRIDEGYYRTNGSAR